jgi:enoyl-CoA hydratase/carnithine racemase
MTTPPFRSDVVRLEIAGPVATVTLDSPRNRNALSHALVVDLTQALTAAAAAENVKIVLLTHTGNTFCAGADLREATTEGMSAGARRVLALLRTVVALPTPVVAVVRGHVRAGGIGLVGACDLALTTNASSFAFSEVRLGLTPAVISLTTVDKLSPRTAARMFLTGVTFDGAEAARAGLVTAAVPEADLDDTVQQLSAELVQASTQGLRETKQLLNEPVLARIDRDGERLMALSSRLFASAEAQERMSAALTRSRT